MSHPQRPPRPQRAALPSPPDFARLDRAHQAAFEMLAAFDRLLAHLQDQGIDSAAQQSAREVLDFFAGPGRRHHADEEQLVFPLLLAGADTALVQQVRRLQQDHGWLEEDWLELAPQVEAVASGYNWYDLPMLRAALPIFTALYHEHIALEESIVYPAARQARQALNIGEQTRSAAL